MRNIVKIHIVALPIFLFLITSFNDIKANTTFYDDIHDSRVHPQQTSGFTSLSIAPDHACGITVDHSIICWGRNDYGQADPPDGVFTVIDAGHDHTCAITENKSVICWGQDAEHRQLNEKLKAVSVGGNITCGIKLDDSATCWDQNGTIPLNVNDKFQIIDAGHHNGHVCGINTDERVVCWGRNNHGQATPPDGKFIDVSAGDIQTCALSIDKKVICWGSDWHNRSTPPNNVFKTVVTSWAHSCGIRDDNGISCWGSNSTGESTPPNGEFKYVGVGAEHSCALKYDGTVTCWGSNAYGKSNPTDLVDLVTYDLPKPPEPQNISVTDGQADGDVIVSWTNIPRAGFYRIGWISIEDYEKMQSEGRAGLDAFTFLDSANMQSSNYLGKNQRVVSYLKPGGEYYFVVGSLTKRFGEANWSQWEWIKLKEFSRPCLEL